MGLIKANDIAKEAKINTESLKNRVKFLNQNYINLLKKQ